jgi:microcystin-dependent protein
MSTPYLSEIRIVSFNFAPKGWALCNGQTLAISQNAALFALIGTFYGGDGVSTFQLPNLQGASAINMGTSPAGIPYVIGQIGGQVDATLITQQIPTHSHLAQGVSTVANLEPAAGNAWAASTANPYAASSDGTLMNAGAVAQTGGSQPHYNMPPYLVVNYVIALQGIFPSRS